MDDATLRKHLALCQKQIPFALALSLTRTMQGTQTDTLKEEPAHFKIRTDYLTRKSSPGYFRVVPARKDRLEATLGTRGPLMEQEVFGGAKVPNKAGLMTVPATGGSAGEGLRGKGGSGTLMRGEGKWAKALVRQGGGYFLKRVKAFAGKEGGPGAKGNDTRTYKGKSAAILDDVAEKDILFRHTGPTHSAAHGYLNLPAGRQVYDRAPIQAVYVFAREANIPARFPFQKIVQASVDKLWVKAVEAAVNEALWTAK
jgi:hypothetical protein